MRVRACVCGVPFLFYDHSSPLFTILCLENIFKKCNILNISNTWVTKAKIICTFLGVVFFVMKKKPSLGQKYLIFTCYAQVPKNPSPVTQSTDPAPVASQTQSTPRQAYKTEIVGGVVVHTPVQQVLSCFCAFFLHLY